MINIFERRMKGMNLSSLLALPDGLEVVSITTTKKLLTVHIAACAASSVCPLCARAATHVRSYYTRLVADVPCAGRQVQLVLRVRKFRCDTAGCPRKIFAERLGPFIEAWARKTTRLREAIEAIGLSTCGEVGARLAERLGIQTSPTIILRRIMDLPLPAVGTVMHLGLDDFALRRGRTYGTVLVDLTCHRVLDLLPDRQTKTAKAWIQAHPEIELISRDRGGDYAAAARQGAPQALQAADRFHLVKNLAEAVQKALSHCGTQLRKDRKVMEMTTALSSQKPPPSQMTSDGQPYSAHQTERYERYQQVVALREQGVKIKEIAKRVGLGTRTVQGWLKAGAYVETNYHHKHRSRYDAYAPYVQQRWREGCHNIQQLWREIRAQGYPHSDRALRRHLEALSGERQRELPEASWLDHFSAKKAVWLFIRPFEDLKEQEQEELLTLRQASAGAEVIYQLVQEFLGMVHHLQGDQLDAWIAQVTASHIKALQRFAKGLQRDKAAVLIGLTCSYNNGQTEGQVTRIKLIKRMMYGRASFALLRQRVLHRF
jgi:transposase